VCNQHTRGIAATRHRSLVRRGGRKAVVRDKGLARTKKKKSAKTDISRISKKCENMELPAKLLNDFLLNNKSNIN